MVDKPFLFCYKYTVNVEATWTHIGPRGSTAQVHHDNIGSFVIVHKSKQGALTRGYYNNTSYAEPVLS